eukprot:ANDGO_04288.mRNA.1 Ataxin-3 homolog
MNTAVSTLPLLVYHETQQFALCGLHAVNSLLQSSYFTAADFSTFAQECDQQERGMLYGSHSAKHHGDDDDGSNATSKNVSDDGNFSIQVIEKALSVFGLTLSMYTTDRNREIREDPCRACAYLCNLESHWLTLRKFGNRSTDDLAALPEEAFPWMNLDSLQPEPTLLSATHLALFIEQLATQGYTVFVVEGKLPAAAADEAAAETLRVQLQTTARRPSNKSAEVKVAVKFPDERIFEFEFSQSDRTDDVLAFAESFAGRTVVIDDHSFIPGLSLGELRQLTGNPAFEWTASFP